MFIRWLNRKANRYAWHGREWPTWSYTENILAIVIMVLLLMILVGCGNEKAEEKPLTETKTGAKVEEKFFTNGQYKVGVDLTAGEYIAIGTGYVEVATAPEGADKIIVNDNIENAQRYVTAQDGQYIKVMGDIKLYPVASAPKIKADKNIPAGQFKAGSDISAGEYKITLEPGGYFAITNTTGRDITKNQFTNEGGTFYATVADGQYLQIKKGSGEFVGAANKPAPQPTPAPAKVVNLGMTLEQFKQIYRSNSLRITGKEFSIDNAQVKIGGVQDVFQSKVSDDVIVMGSIDKANGLIKEVWVLCGLSDVEKITDGLIAYGIIMSILNPELTTDQRGDLMIELKLMSERVTDLQDTPSKAMRGNIRYSASIISVGALMMSASPKDL